MANLTLIGASKLADLLVQADPSKSMYVQVLSSSRLAHGTDPLKPTAVVDFSKEAIVPFAEGTVPENGDPKNFRQTEPEIPDSSAKRALGFNVPVRSLV